MKYSRLMKNSRLLFLIACVACAPESAPVGDDWVPLCRKIGDAEHEASVERKDRWIDDQHRSQLEIKFRERISPCF